MKKVTKKRIIIYGAVIAAIAAIVLISNAVKSNNEKMAQFDVTPSTSTAVIEDIGIYVPASGTISSGNMVSVSADTQGSVTDIYFETGDFVNAGDVIAVVEGETLQEKVDALQADIDAQRSSIDEFDNEEQDYTIKSPVRGRVKEINVRYVTSLTDESYRERAEDIEEEYGYLVAIAVGDSMYIEVTKDIDQYEVGQEVDAIIHEEDGDKRVYSGAYVEKIEDGTVYIYVNNNSYDENVSATIYTPDGTTAIGEGVTMYPQMAYVVGANGYIEATSTYINQLVNEGDILYYAYSKLDQNLINMYIQLEELEEELAELQQQYANLEITAPVSGFLSDINVLEGSTVSADTKAFSIADTSIWTATVAVDELDINSIDLGMSAIVTIDAIPDEEFEGTVKRISSVGATSSGVTTYTVEIEVPADERFKLSMNASSEIEIEKVEDAVSVPIQAVRYQGDQAYVLVYVERTEEELKEIQDQILSAQQQAEEMANMSQEELQAQMEEMREQMGTSMQKGQGNFDASNMDAEAMEDMRGQMSSRMTTSNTSLSVADQLYGEMVMVEVGIQDETNIEIISGLEAGTVVLLPTTEDDSSSSTTETSGFGMGGGMMGGGMMGGRP